jgi:hypothetical protein
MSALGEGGLAAVATTALEEAAFLFVEPAPELAVPSERAVVATIGIATPARAQLRVVTDPDGARLLAANVLGVEADDPDVDAQSEAAVGELANILAGLVLVELAAPGAPTAIDIPRLGPAAAGARPGCGVSLVTAEGHPFRFELSWEDGDDA